MISRSCTHGVLDSVTVKLVLHVVYPDEYPDTLPELSLYVLEGDLGDDEIERLITEMKTAVSLHTGMEGTCSMEM